jgi:hypothetical protein
MIASKIISTLEYAYKNARQTTVTIEGQPGLGKSALMYQFKNQVGAKLIEFRPGNHGIEDLIGLPDFIQKEDGLKQSIFAKPDWLPNVERDGENGIFFIDEFAQASIPMQNALSSLIHHPRQLHDYKFPDSWMIVVAYNGPKWRAATNKMPSHIQDRLKPEISMDFSIEDWTKWAETKGNIDPSLIAYSKFKKAIFDEQNFDPKQRFNVTPRSIETVNSYIQAPPAIRDELISGIIGPGHAAGFLGFLRIWQDLPDIDQIIKNPGSVPVPTKPDVLYALTQSLAYSCTPQNADHLAAFTTKLPDEFEVIFYKDALRRDQKVAQSKAFQTFLSNNAELVI